MTVVSETFIRTHRATNTVTQLMGNHDEINLNFPLCNLKLTVQRIEICTSESPVYIVDFPEKHTAPSHLNHAACFDSGAVLSDGTCWTLELLPEIHSPSLLFHSD